MKSELEQAKLSSEQLDELEEEVLEEAGGRITGIGTRLEAHLPELRIKSLRDYMTLSLHQCALAKFISGRMKSEPYAGTDRTGTGRYFQTMYVRRREISEVEMELLQAMARRVRAMGRTLDEYQDHMEIKDFRDFLSLSRHQLRLTELVADPPKAQRTIRSKDRVEANAQTAERVEALGRALKEYEGGIEIKSISDFVRLSRHQCELVGLVMPKTGRVRFTMVGWAPGADNSGQGAPDDGGGPEGTEKDTTPQKKSRAIILNIPEPGSYEDVPETRASLDENGTNAGDESAPKSGNNADADMEKAEAPAPDKVSVHVEGEVRYITGTEAAAEELKLYFFDNRPGEAEDGFERYFHTRTDARGRFRTFFELEPGELDGVEQDPEVMNGLVFKGGLPGRSRLYPAEGTTLKGRVRIGKFVRSLDCVTCPNGMWVQMLKPEEKKKPERPWLQPPRPPGGGYP